MSETTFVGPCGRLPVRRTSVVSSKCGRSKWVTPHDKRCTTRALLEPSEEREKDAVSESNPLKPLVTSKVPILRSSGIRAGYIIACIAAALAGAPILAVSGAFFSVLSAATGAPTPLTSLAAVLVAIFIDVSNRALQTNSDTSMFGTSTEGIGFALYIGIVAVLIFIDDDVEYGISMKGSVDDAARRVDEAKAARQKHRDDAQRASLVQELGLRDVDPKESQEPNLPQQTMKSWDERLDRKND
jgi:hypothetical protein